MSDTVEAPAPKKPKKTKEAAAPAEPVGGVAVWRHIGELQEHPKNPRSITAEAIDYLVNGMRRFGFPAPIVVWKGHDLVVAGHARLKAIGKLLRTTSDFTFAGSPGPGFVPVVEYDFASRQDADAYMLADNRTHELAGWERSGVDELLDTIAAGGSSVSDLGWDTTDLAVLDEAPPPAPAAAPLVKPPTPEGLKPSSERFAELALEVTFGRFRIELSIPDAQAMRESVDRYSAVTGTYEAFGDELARAF